MVRCTNVHRRGRLHDNPPYDVQQDAENAGASAPGGVEQALRITAAAAVVRVPAEVRGYEHSRAVALRRCHDRGGAIAIDRLCGGV